MVGGNGLCDKHVVTGFLHGADVMTVRGKEGKSSSLIKKRSGTYTGEQRKMNFLLTGTCWYELWGLWHLLSGQGHNVYCASP
ncbi:hypothetical protein NGB58_27805, partial [Escherichia coli]|nr:hypothetical protein [Escherichia coli]